MVTQRRDFCAEFTRLPPSERPDYLHATAHSVRHDFPFSYSEDPTSPFQNCLKLAYMSRGDNNSDVESGGWDLFGALTRLMPLTEEQRNVRMPYKD